MSSRNILEIDIDPITDVSLRNYSDCDVKIENCDIRYQHFFNEYMLKNLPCVIKNLGCNWECFNMWIQEGVINYDHLIDTYGDLEVPVADCMNVTLDSQCKSNMKVADYMLYLKDSSKSNNKLLYLKDWHLRRCRPKDLFYDVPEIFGSDWLNEYAQDKQEDDFMFVYIGPKDSWTPLHADVYCSYSWSVNVSGRKKWLLFPPGEEAKLKDKYGNLPLMFEPHLDDGNIKYFEIIQETGDGIFVPSGWHHQVVNTLDTVSINHNWINGCNILDAFTALQDTLLSVQKEIDEFRNTPDFSDQCQLILKSLFGMDLVSFISFLCYIAEKRLLQLHDKCCKGFDKYTLGDRQITFDLKNILKILNLISDHPTLNTFLPKENPDFALIKSSITDILK